MARREFLKMLVLGAMSFVAHPLEVVEARALSGIKLSGKLALCSQHSGERLIVQYLNKKGCFDQDAYKQLNYFFRCRYTNETRQINSELFLVLDALRCQLGARERPFLLYSGYRSPDYNRILKREDPEVAKNSFHMKGMAADVSIEGVSLKDLKRTAKALKCGGIGKYDDFIHLDVGPVRCW